MSEGQVNQSNSGAGDAGAGGDWPKASIGNYKGVMLCNRPNEFGQQRRPERTGLEPFNSRVSPGEPLGWNPTMKLLPRDQKKKRDPNSILTRHRKFLKQLEAQKNLEREEEMEAANEADRKKRNFKDQAAKQRSKIKVMKASEIDEQNMDAGVYGAHQFEEAAPISVAASSKKPEKLTRANVDALSQASKPAPKKGKGAKQAKPAWAVTAAQQEEDKEAEIDSLLEFAYELDYEKYMEDYEVRQALALIKDRVNEMTQEDDWKEKMAEEWNKANEEEKLAKVAKQRAQQIADDDVDARSRASVQTGASRASNASYMSRVAEEKKKRAAQMPEWDASTTASKQKKTIEERVASKIAGEVLRDNPKLRSVHSEQSVKQILEREAKRQMLLKAQGGEYQGPIISKIEEKGKTDKKDPSNLPYLHKHPAV